MYKPKALSLHSGAGLCSCWITKVLGDSS